MNMLLIIFCLSVCSADVNSDLFQGLKRLEQKIEDMQFSLMSVKSENENMKSRIKKLENANVALDERCSNTSGQGHEGKDKMKRLLAGSPTYVAFHANLNYGVSIHDNDVIPFQSVHTNLESAYDGTTGIFKAPTQGYYVFFIHFLARHDKHIEALLIKNGNNLQNIYAGATGTEFGPGSNMAITELNQGDKVWVKIHSTFHSDGDIVDGPWCTFAGFLLYPTI